VFAFLLCICFVYAVHVISGFKLKSERGENKFQLFLYLSQEIPARCAVEFIRKECIDEGSVSLTLVLIHPEVRVGC
jgi:hypothetical protein